MLPKTSCPKCGNESIIDGHIIDGGQMSSKARFLPRNLEFKVFTDQWWGVELRLGFCACLQCGLVWSMTDSTALRAFLVQHGNKLSQELVDEFNRGALRDLPDTEATRELARRVALIDDLIRGEQQAEAAKLFRQLRNVSWDEAHAATRHWHELTRLEKLERFGWVSKKPTLDDLDGPDF